jgi:hypothetical protein
MPTRTVTCSSCRAIQHQDVATDSPLHVDPCSRCGAFGIMSLETSFSLTQLPHPKVLRTSRWDCRMIERALKGSAAYKKLIASSFGLAEYKLIGFHGCGFKSACAIMRGGIDPGKNSVGARGRGFYVGSRHDGIPKRWAKISEGNGDGIATVLAVYVRRFQNLAYGVDFDWGMMDGDDVVGTTGLEIVFFGDACNQLGVVPAIGTEVSTLWGNCPIDSLSPSERVKATQAANAIGKSSALLAQWIMLETLDDNLSDEEMATVESYF